MSNRGSGTGRYQLAPLSTLTSHSHNSVSVPLDSQGGQKISVKLIEVTVFVAEAVSPGTLYNQY